MLQLSQVKRVNKHVVDIAHCGVTFLCCIFCGDQWVCTVCIECVTPTMHSRYFSPARTNQSAVVVTVTVGYPEDNVMLYIV